MRILFCLTIAACATMHAGTLYTETTDFSDNPLTPFLLPAGTSTVDGSVGGSDDGDFFEFTGLAGNSPFTLIAQNIDLTEIAIEILSDAQVVLVGPTDLSLSASQIFHGTTPADGNLVVGIGVIVAEGGQQPSTQGLIDPYEATLAPEPGTIAFLGFGFLGMLWAALVAHATRRAASTIGSTKIPAPHLPKHAL